MSAPWWVGLDSRQLAAGLGRRQCWCCPSSEQSQIPAWQTSWPWASWTSDGLLAGRWAPGADRLEAAKSLQSCPTLCDPIDSSPPGFPIPGILQARTLEWVAISFSNAWKWKVKVKSLSRVRLCATPWTAAYQAPPSMGFSRQEYWSGVPLPSPDRLEEGHHDITWQHNVLMVKWAPRMAAVSICVPSVSPSCCLLGGSLRSASRSDPGFFQITDSAMGLEVCKIWHSFFESRVCSV